MFFNNSTKCKEILQNPIADIAYNSFLQIYQKHHDKAFPVKTKVIKTKSFNNPWITP